MSDWNGEIYWKNGWFIKTQPHIAVRLKRIFPKIDRGSQGIIHLSDTPENARELEWFLQRYPHKVLHPEKLKERADQHREKESLIQRMLQGSLVPSDFAMAEPPREYQKIAAELWKASGGLLLADDMGLGKSVTAIAGFVDPRLRPVLVVMMAHLPKQWLGFIHRFTPHLNTHILQKGTPYDLTGRFHGLSGETHRLSTKRGTGMPDVILCSYSKLSGWASTLAQLVKSVVWDECQELRHPGTQKYNAAQCVAEAVKWRMGLSGTPIYNYGVEMFNVMACISPDTLGSRYEFLNEWCQGGEEVKDPRAFGSYLRSQGSMLRRTRSDVGRELPKCQSIVHTIEADTQTIESEAFTCEGLAHVILRETEDYRGQKMHAAGEFDMRLRQATGIAKAGYVAEFVKILLESGERVVLYGWHRAVYEIWIKRLLQYGPTLYTGSESPGQKEFSKTRFMRGDSRVLLISLRSGAGLDGLQEVCSTVVFGELDWSPGVHEQCIKRLDRDGQTKPVFAYYLVAEEGSDPVIADVCGIKSRQLEGIRDPDADLIERLTVDPDHVKKLAQEFLKNHRSRQESDPNLSLKAEAI